MRDWKQAERRIASMLGGRRIPVSGRGRGDAPDVDHPTLSIEVKTRGKLPAWIEDAMRQAEASAAVEASSTGTPAKTPATVLHLDNKPYREALVLLRLGDFAEIIRERSEQGRKAAG